MDQKGLKTHEKRQKIEFLDLKNLLFNGIFLSGIGGYPPPPLTENHPAQKPLAEMGVTPTLTEKICEVVFDRFPKHEPYFELHGKPFNVVLSYLMTR